jgi:hypothetical protein
VLVSSRIYRPVHVDDESVTADCFSKMTVRCPFYDMTALTTKKQERQRSALDFDRRLPSFRRRQP